jgi:hypothetical protein
MNNYYSLNDQQIIDNIIVVDSDAPELIFNEITYYLNTNNLQIGQSPNYTYYEQVREALDGRLADTDFWELPSVQQEVSNGQELIDYRIAVRALRLNLTQENFMEIYDAIPEKPSASWTVK